MVKETDFFLVIQSVFIGVHLWLGMFGKEKNYEHNKSLSLSGFYWW